MARRPLWNEAGAGKPNQYRASALRSAPRQLSLFQWQGTVLRGCDASPSTTDGQGPDALRAPSPGRLGTSPVGSQVASCPNISAPLNILTSAMPNNLVSDLPSNRGMTNDEINRENLELLIKEAAGNESGWGGVGKVARRLDVTSAVVSQWRNASLDWKSGKPRSMGDETARRLEAAFNKPRGWMDVRHNVKSEGADQPAQEPAAPEQQADQLAEAQKLLARASKISSMWLELPESLRLKYYADMESDLRHIKGVEPGANENNGITQNHSNSAKFGGAGRPSRRARKKNADPKSATE